MKYFLRFFESVQNLFAVEQIKRATIHIHPKCASVAGRPANSGIGPRLWLHTNKAVVLRAKRRKRFIKHCFQIIAFVGKRRREARVE